VQLTALTVVLRMGEAVFAFIEARKEAKAPKTPPAPAAN
jgi:hypothetical protein